MRKSSIYSSVFFHLACLIIATVSLPFLKKDFVIPPPISVEFVDVAELTQTTKVTPQPAPKPDEKKEPSKPAQAATNTSSDPVKPKPVKDEKPDVKKDKSEVVDELAPPDKKKDKKKDEKKPKVEDKPKDFSSILKNLAEPKKPAPATDEKPNPKADAAADDGQKAPVGPKMTMSEEDALRRQLESCWTVPIGAKDAGNLIIEIYMVINPDRTLREAKVVDTSRYNSDSFFRAAADSALRAVNSPKCSPFELPPDKYDTWKTTTVVFNPSEMF